MTIADVEYCRDNAEDCHEDITLARTLVDDAVREVRVISYLMHPPLLEEAGLRPALLSYARGFADRSGVDLHVDIAGDLGRHPQEIEITIFRIVQEALTNVYRHSGSQTAQICLKIKNRQIHLDIRDRGRGLPSCFEASGPNTMLGVGIVGIRERVKQLGGVFHIEGAPGCGTLLRIALPCVQSPASAASKMPLSESFNCGFVE